MGTERVKELEALLKEAYNALGLWEGLTVHSTISSEECMCGMREETHDLYSGHSYCDSGEYYAKIAEDVTRDLVPRIGYVLGIRG